MPRVGVAAGHHQDVRSRRIRRRLQRFDRLLHGSGSPHSIKASLPAMVCRLRDRAQQRWEQGWGPGPGASARVLAAILGLTLPCPTSLSDASPAPARGEFEDPRDGNAYPTVEIGGMIWFGENLAWAAPGSFCYDDDDEENCRVYGRLYRWEQALAACPPGSHLASELEWQALERAAGLPEVEIGQWSNRGTIEGARLKTGGDLGFDVRYGGWRHYRDGSFSALDENAAFWTSTEDDLAHAQHRDIDVDDDMIWRSPEAKHYALSVRCVVDRYDQDEYPGDDTHPVFSPDGTRIAYISNREGVAVGRAINFEVYVLDLATRRERRLTFNDAFEADLAWSPDGSRLAFKSFRDGNDEIYLMAADGSRQVNLTRHPASDGGPSFTPDGEHLIFASDRDGDRERYRMRTDGSALERLTDQPGGDHSPSLSPDGERIAFVSDRDGNDEVYLMAANGGHATRVTEAPLSDGYPVWSPDSRSLVVTYGDWEDDRWSLVRVSLDDSRREVLFEGNDSGNASWRARDGALAFGAPVRGDDGETGAARIHLGLPGGAGPQPVSGRRAGVFGGRNGGRADAEESARRPVGVPLPHHANVVPMTGEQGIREASIPTKADFDAFVGYFTAGSATWQQDRTEPDDGGPIRWVRHHAVEGDVSSVEVVAVYADGRCEGVTTIRYRWSSAAQAIEIEGRASNGSTAHGAVEELGDSRYRTVLQVLLPDGTELRMRDTSDLSAPDAATTTAERWSDGAWVPLDEVTWRRVPAGARCEPGT